MKRNTNPRPSASEKRLFEIVRRLPPERIAEIIDFAQFLESRLEAAEKEQLDQGESQEEIAAENAEWDALLATEESQRLLEKLAGEAEAEIKAGHARPIVFTEDGEIAPE